jgi:hypothetical protein
VAIESREQKPSEDASRCLPEHCRPRSKRWVAVVVAVRHPSIVPREPSQLSRRGNAPAAAPRVPSSVDTPARHTCGLVPHCRAIFFVFSRQARGRPPRATRAPGERGRPIGPAERPGSPRGRRAAKEQGGERSTAVVVVVVVRA